MLQALLDNGILLLFLVIFVVLVVFGFVGTYFQDKEEKLYDERMRLLQGRAWRDTYYLLVAMGVLVMCGMLFFHLMGREIPVDMTVSLAFICCCSLSFFISDCIVRGVFAGRKETPVLYLSQGLASSSVALVFSGMTILGGERLLTPPLTFRIEVFYLLMMIYTVSYACACWIRFITLRQELSETNESDHGEANDE